MILESVNRVLLDGGIQAFLDDVPKWVHMLIEQCLYAAAIDEEELYERDCLMCT